MQHFQGEQTSKHKGKASLHYVKFHFFKHTFTGKKHLIFIFTAFAILTHISLTFYKRGGFHYSTVFKVHAYYIVLTYDLHIQSITYQSNFFLICM